jgi:hypothetical protein
LPIESLEEIREEELDDSSQKSIYDINAILLRRNPLQFTAFLVVRNGTSCNFLVSLEFLSR